MAKPWRVDVYELEYRFVRARNRLHFRLAPRDAPDARKIFVVGHPRTGTGTLHRIFLANGLDSVHTAGSWKTARHECFSDRGNYQPLDLLADYYRNAKFVLNTRPLAHYLRSRANQTINKRRRHRGQLVPRFSTANVRNEILRRNAHLFDFVQRFHGRDDFVVINIERAGTFELACRCLGLQYPGEIWHNRTSGEIEPTLARRIDAALAELGAPNGHEEPFVLRTLLERDDQRRLDAFLRGHADRVLL